MQRNEFRFYGTCIEFLIPIDMHNVFTMVNT